MAKTYDIRYDRDQKKYKPVDVTAALLQRKQGAFVDVDNPDTQFEPQQDNLLSVEVRKQGQVWVGQVGVQEAALQRADFQEAIKQPVDLKVTARTPPGADGKSRDLVEICQIKIHPVPATVRMVRPTEGELPVPARSDQPVEVELELLAAGDKPMRDTSVSLEFREQTSPRKGKWDPAGSIKTDGNGRVIFNYTPADLAYRPGGVYIEKFAVKFGEAGEEAGILELPVAPRLKASIAVEKLEKVKEKEIGFKFDPQPIDVELGPAKRHDRVTIRPRLESQARDVLLVERPAHAKVKIEVEDEGTKIPIFAEGQEPKTDAQGSYVWKLPELARVFKEPTALSLDTDDLNPKGPLNPVTEAIIDASEDKIRDHFPKSLMEAPLVSAVESFRSVFVHQIAERETTDFARVWSGLELMTQGACYTRLWNDQYNRQWSQLPDYLGTVLSDIMGLVINLVGLGDKVVKEWGPGVVTWCREGVEKIAGMPCIRSIVSYVRGKLASVFSSVRGSLTQISDFLAAELPGTWTSIGARVNTLLAELGADINRLVGTTLPDDVASVGEVTAAIRDWLYNLLRVVVNAMGNLLMAIGDCLRGLLMWAIEKIGKVMAATWETLTPWIDEYVRPALSTVGDWVAARFTSRSNTLENVHASLAKMIEAIVAWANEQLKVTDTVGGGIGGVFVSHLGLMDMLADPAVGHVVQRAKDLHVPQDFEPHQKLYRDLTTYFREEVGKGEALNARVDEWMSHIDTAVLCVELVVMGVMTVFNLAGAAAFASACTKLEIGISATKLALVRLPQGITLMVMAFAVALMYALGTAALPVEAV